MIAINVVRDEEQAAAVQALADVHTGGDMAEMIRLLVLERAQPTRFSDRDGDAGAGGGGVKGQRKPETGNLKPESGSGVKPETGNRKPDCEELAL